MAKIIYLNREKLQLLPYEFVESVATKIFEKNAFKRHKEVIETETIIEDAMKRGTFDEDGKEWTEGKKMFMAFKLTEITNLKEKYESMI